MNILVFIQTNDNQINRMSLEALACAQNLNHSIYALTFDEKAAEELSHYKLNEIILVKNSNLNDYNPLHYASTLNKVMTDDFDAIFFEIVYRCGGRPKRIRQKSKIKNLKKKSINLICNLKSKQINLKYTIILVI